MRLFYLSRTSAKQTKCLPVQGILIHGVNIGEVGDAEEEHGAVLGDRHVQQPRLVDLALSDGGRRLLGLDLDRQHLGRRQDPVG